MARMLSGTFNYNHDNPLIREIGNEIHDLPFRIQCRCYVQTPGF